MIALWPLLLVGSLVAAHGIATAVREVLRPGRLADWRPNVGPSPEYLAGYVRRAVIHDGGEGR